MVKGDTWRRLFLHHTAISLPSVLFSVGSIQSVVPYAAFTTQETSGWMRGVAAGVLVGSFVLGRALGTPVWRWLAHYCGRRAIIQIALLVEIILTLSFGLSEQIATMIEIRLAIGFFYQGNAFGRDMLIKDVATSPEDIPLIVTLSVLLQSLCHTCGFLLGAFTKPTWELPYLEVCISTSILLLVCFWIVSFDFLDDPKKEVRQQAKKNVEPSDLHFEKFENEGGEKPKSQSNQGDNVPSYLEQFSESVSPDTPQLKILKGIFQSASVDTLTEENNTQESIDQSDVQIPPEEFVKRTHISFTEADLPIPAPATPPPPTPSLGSPSFPLSLFVYSTLVFVCTTSEYSGLFWVVWQGGKHIADPSVIGLVLASSAGLSTFLSPLVTKAVGETVGMNKAAFGGMVVGGCGAVLVPVLLAATQGGWVAVGLLVVAMAARETGGNLAFSVLVMRVSDAVSFSARSQALSLTDFTATVAKAVGIVSGPALLFPTLLAHPQSSLIFTLFTAGVWTIATGLLVWAGKTHPRLSILPFRL